MIQWDWDTSSWCIRCMLGSRSSNAESFAKSGRWYSLTNTNTLGALLITPSFSHQRLLWSRLKSMGEWQHVKCWLQFHECFMLICHSHYLLSFNVSHSQYFHWPCHALDRKVISLHILQFGCLCAWEICPSFQVTRCTDGLPSHSFCQAWGTTSHSSGAKLQTAANSNW